MVNCATPPFSFRRQRRALQPGLLLSAALTALGQLSVGCASSSSSEDPPTERDPGWGINQIYPNVDLMLYSHHVYSPHATENWLYFVSASFVSDPYDVGIFRMQKEPGAEPQFLFPTGGSVQWVQEGNMLYALDRTALLRWPEDSPQDMHLDVLEQDPLLFQADADTFYATVHGCAEVWLFDKKTLERRVIQVSEGQALPAITSDGQNIYCWEGGKYHVIDKQSGKVESFELPPYGELQGPVSLGSLVAWNGRLIGPMYQTPIMLGIDRGSSTYDELIFGPWRNIHKMFLQPGTSLLRFADVYVGGTVWEVDLSNNTYRMLFGHGEGSLLEDASPLNIGNGGTAIDDDYFYFIASRDSLTSSPDIAKPKGYRNPAGLLRVSLAPQ